MKTTVMILMAAMGSITTAGVAADSAPLATVAHVDLARYLGTWYELAKYPNPFQKNCLAAIATYSLRPDGDIKVVNTCHKKTLGGPLKTANGKAWVVDKSSNAKLKVQFFWPFRGDYWIIQLGDNYEYAVVGEPKRTYLWILSRTPTLPEPVMLKILNTLVQQGYDPDKLEITEHPTQEAQAAAVK
jgi:apolipoprotein D and lipocalin family protein